MVYCFIYDMNALASFFSFTIRTYINLSQVHYHVKFMQLFFCTCYSLIQPFDFFFFVENLFACDCRVHQGRKSYQTGDVLLSDEHLLCIGSSRKRPVLKWESNIAWPGNLILTDNALYFEV